MPQFCLIQGGMGVGVSGWTLARAVSRRGQLGVVSGTGLAVVLARRLQQGDPDGHMRRALASFPYPALTHAILERYFAVDHRLPSDPFRLSALPRIEFADELTTLTVLANYVEVWLAKEGHPGLVGVNYLEKVQTPTLPSIYGAMLAGVDYVLMGAGIPRHIPGILDRLARGEPVELPIDVEGADASQRHVAHFDPRVICAGPAPTLRRPHFLAIVSSATLAMTLARKAGGVDGFVVETSTAGGHNAPPRGVMQLNDRGEPVYGPRDDADLEKIRALGLPFWLAGGYADAAKLAHAQAAGAQGIQVGTAFAFCAESGIEPDIKRQVIALSRAGRADVFTDPLASPTGFPFKVLRLDQSLSTTAVYEQRVRVCDLGYLRHPYQRADGAVGYRCPAEPVAQYVNKGGKPEDTVGRKCICNALFATVGLGQLLPDDAREQPLITAGEDVATLVRFLKPDCDTYSADDVLNHILGPQNA